MLNHNITICNVKWHSKMSYMLDAILMFYQSEDHVFLTFKKREI